MLEKLDTSKMHADNLSFRTLPALSTDCGVIATRVMLLLDDLLWVLTDTQLKAAILYINSLKDMIEKSRQQSKNVAAEKLDVSLSCLIS